MNQQLGPFSESTGGDRRVRADLVPMRADLVPIWCHLRTALFHAGQCLRTKLAQATGLLPHFRTLGRDPGRSILRQLRTFDPRPRSWAQDLAFCVPSAEDLDRGPWTWRQLHMIWTIR